MTFNEKFRGINMRYITIFAMAIMFVGGCQKTYMAVDAEKAKLSGAQLQEVSRAERLGEELFMQDTIAAKSSHILMKVAGPIKPGELSGWIIVKEDPKTLTRFIKQTGEDVNAVYDVLLGAKGSAEVAKDNLRPLSKTEIAMFRARQIAIASAPKDCAGAYNTAVIKDTDSEGWLVYVLAAAARNAIVVGGHSRVKVSAGGDNVLSVTPLYKSCLDLPIPADVKSPKDQAFSVIYPVADVPSEIHVYLNRLHGYTVYVTTAKGTWRVRDGRIAIIKKAETEKAAKE
jgi:hypothetical protein